MFTIQGVTITDDKSMVIVLQFVHAPPFTIPTLTPAPDASGIYPGPVTISLSATAAPGYTVSATHYRLDGGPDLIYSGPIVVLADGTHTLQYWSVDNIGVFELPKTLSFQIASLRIVTESPLPDGMLGQPYSALLEAAGGTPPYTWSIAAGALPPGLSLDPASGLISGIPTTVGTFGFTVQVTDSSLLAVTKQFYLAPPPTEGTAGTTYTLPISVPDTPPESDEGTPTCTNYELVSGTLPEGMTLDPTTGVISGIPLDGGTYVFTVQCVVTEGQTVTKEFTITINNPYPTLASLNPAAVRAGGAAFELLVNGTNFVTSSVVQWNGSSRPTTYISQNQLRAAIPAEDILEQGTADITVVNPPPIGGTSNVLVFTINPPNQAPVLNPLGPFSVGEGSTVQVEASGGDPDGDPIQYAWDLDNDGTFETAGQSVTFSAAALDGPDSQAIAVQITDSLGLSDSSQAVVEILNVNPTATFATPDANINEWESASLSFSYTFDPGLADTAAGFTYSYDCTGNGWDIEHTTAASYSCLYPDNGVYTAQGRIQDKDGGYTTYSLTINVDLVAPVADFIVSDGEIFEGGSATLSFSNPYDPSPVDTEAGFLYSYDCDSDGTWEATDTAEMSYVCDYPDNGTFTVKGRIADKDGAASDYTGKVVVSNVSPDAEFSNASGAIQEGQAATLAFNNPSDPSPVDTAAGFLYSYDCTNDGSWEVIDVSNQTYTCAYPDNGTFTARGRIKDKDGGANEYPALVSVVSVAPTASLENQSGTILEGSSATLALTNPFDPSLADTEAGFLYSFDCRGDGVWEVEDGPSAAYDCSYADNGSFTVIGRIEDKDGAANEYTITVLVESVAPSAEFTVSDSPILEGESTGLVFTNIYDPSPIDTEAGILYSYDCTDDGIWELMDGSDATFTCSYDDDGEYTVRGRVSDKDGASSEYTGTVLVENVAPTADFVNNSGTIFEGQSATLAFTNLNDPGQDDLDDGLLFSYDCTDNGTWEAVNTPAGTYACAYPDNGIFTVLGRVTDKDGGFTEYRVSVMVNNVAPLVGPITAPVDPMQVGTAIVTRANFTDPGILDTHTATWEWGDGTSTYGLVTESNGSGYVIGSHAYTLPGTYVIKLTVTDKDGGEGYSIFQYVVIFDPDAGFVTGGGYTISPAGSVVADPLATGTATWGFVSKYYRDDLIPDGETEFHLNTAQIQFHSTTYDWLVVIGPKAIYRGSGTVNDIPGYRFMVIVIDGQALGGGGVDKFRMIIWHVDANGMEQLIYDSEMGTPIDADPTTALYDGSIIIHEEGDNAR